MSWIQNLLDSTEIYEAPNNYYFWSGLAAISASVRDKVWLRRGSDKFKTYPNIYVLLLAKTGITRKSAPISLIQQIISEAKVTRVISGRSSIEKIIDDLGTSYTTESGMVVRESSALIIAGELTASVIGNSQALTILTDLFDRSYYEGVWTINLKSGVKKLNHPCVSFLAATNDQHMKAFFEAKDMYGGFLGRTFVISADAPKRLNSLVLEEELFPDIKELAKYLREISKLEGAFKWECGAAEHFDSWYKGYYGPVHRGEADVDDKTGTFSRIGDHTLKVAMLLSLSKGTNLVISSEDIREAIELCEPFVEVSARAVRGIGKSPLASQTAMVMDFLEKRNGYATRVQILNAFQGDIDPGDLTNIGIHLEETKFAQIEMSRGIISYRMDKDVLDKYRKWKAKS